MAKSFDELEQAAKEAGVGGNKDGWFNAVEGENRFRLVSGFDVLAKHWANGKMLGICVGKEKGCVICNQPEQIDPATKKAISRKPTAKFLMYVIDRADGKIKIAEFGWTIVEAIKNLKTNQEYGFDVLPEYDMVLVKTVKNGGKNISDTSYTVLPARANTPLTSEETEEVSKLKDVTEVIDLMKAKVGVDEDAAAEDEQQVEEINPDDIPV